MKLRNLEQLSPERHAALEVMLNEPTGSIIRNKAQTILESNRDHLKAAIDEGVFDLTTR